jgi:hypothetical protein
MNAPEAHYVANADAKIQPFSGMAITLRLFFTTTAFCAGRRGLIYKQLCTKLRQTANFSLFLYNFAVA